MLARVPTAVVAGASLVGGFALADVTGVRALGGVVLVAGAAWCVVRSLRSAGPWRLGVVLVLGAVLFVASHVVADALGAWPSVLLAALVLAAVTWWLVDRHRGRPAVDDADAGAVRPPTRGMRLTEQLVRFVGPAQVGDQRAPHRAVSADEQAREDQLRTELTRVVGPDGTAYLVERPSPAPSSTLPTDPRATPSA